MTARRQATDGATIALAPGLLAVLAWDASAMDLSVGRLFGNVNGFALRDDFWVSAVLHDGLRQLGLAILAAWTIRLASRRRRPSWHHEACWWAVVVVTVIAVPLLKRFSDTSCPWDLIEFGGVWPHVPHAQWGATDGGPGGCFPSGHAVSAFGFIGVGFLWRERHPGWARAAWVLVLVAGGLAGFAQVARGAHHVSHVLWTAWLCYAIAWGCDRWFARRHSGHAAAGSEPGPAPSDTSAEHGVAHRVPAIEQQTHQRTLRVLLPHTTLDDELPAADAQRVAHMRGHRMTGPEGRDRDLGLSQPGLVVGGEREGDANAGVFKGHLQGSCVVSRPPVGPADMTPLDRRIRLDA
jgi:membrane-associated PAP2 superfamily phosphatase